MSTIVRPIITEKTTLLSEKGKYVLAVTPTATKIQVKKDFKTMYGVDAVDVNTIKVVRKIKLGKNRAELTKRATYKKVIVTTKNKAPVDLSKVK